MERGGGGGSAGEKLKRNNDTDNGVRKPIDFDMHEVTMFAPQMQKFKRAESILRNVQRHACV